MCSGLEAYNAFTIDPIKIVTGEKGAKKITSEDAERIKTYFINRLTEELKAGGYSITDKSGDQTMRISFLLSGLKAPSAAPNITQAVLPITFSVGGVTTEAAFKNSAVDRIDAVVISRSEGARFANASPWSTCKDVEAALDKWADGIRKSLDEAHGK